MRELIKERNEIAKSIFLIKERNEIAKSIFLKNPILTDSVASNAVNVANTLMQYMHGDEWMVNEPSTDQQPTPSGDAIITIHKDAEGMPDGVRVQGLGEDFIITLHDSEDRKEQNYDKWMEWLRENGKTTFTRKQAALICMYIDDINDKLEEAGGDAFDEEWYTTTDLYIPRDKRSCADSNASHSWYFYGSAGCLYAYNRLTGYFRCRPSLALTPLTR